MTSKHLAVILLLFIQTPFAFSMSTRDSLITELNKAIHNKEVYDKAKSGRIEQVRFLLRENDLPLETQFQLYKKLVNEYGTFKYDSAFKYAMKLNEVASNSKTLSK